MGTLTRGHTYQTGEVLTAANLNSEFDRILSTINGGLDSDNIDSTSVMTLSEAQTITGNKSFNSNLTIADGTNDLDIASHDGTNGLKLGGTLVTSTAAELNLLDGVTATTTELNYVDVTTIGTAQASKALVVDGSVNISGINSLSATTFSGALASSVTATTQAASTSDTTVATTAFVQQELTSEDLDFTTSSGSGNVDLDSQALAFTPGEGVDITHSGQAVTIAGEDATTSNKGIASFSSDDFTVSSGAVSLVDITASHISSGTLVTSTEGLATGSDSAIPTTEAVKSYVDSNITAQDLDFSTTTGSGAVDLDSQALAFTPGEGIDITHSGQAVTFAAEDATDSNKGVASFASADFSVSSGAVSLVDLTTSHIAAATLVTSSDTIAGNDDDVTLPTSAAVKAYVDTQIATEDTISELNDTDIGTLASGNLLIYDGTNSWDNKPINGDATLAADGALTLDATNTNLTTLANVTTVGAISTGTWEATDVAVAHGGTGASTASAARTNLGVVIGTDVAAAGANSDITSITGLTTDLAVDHGGTGASTASAARTNLGVAIGSDVQAYDAGLASIAGLTTAADKMVYTTGSDTYAVTSLTEIGRNILDDADAAAVRSTIGAQAAGSYAASGSNSDITELTGLSTDLSVSQGGTGASTFTASGILLGAGTGAVTASAAMTTNGTLLIGGVGGPEVATLTAGSNVTITNGDGTITIASSGGGGGGASAFTDLSDVGDTTATSGNIMVADGDSWESKEVDGDIALAADGTMTIQANSVALGTDTTGNYVATVADAGNSHITVANSGAESAAVTLNIADNAVGLAQMAGLARGKIIVGDSSNDPSALAAGSDGHVLTMDSSGDVGWEAPAQGGHTIQEEGSALTAQTNLNFVGSAVTATNDAGNNATKITIGASGASLPFTRSDGSTSDPITLSSAAIGESLVTDTSPQLGGDLDVNGNAIVSASDGNIAITPNGSGNVILDGITWPNSGESANYILKTNGSGVLSWVEDAGGIASVAADTTPQLGGDLDVNGNSIVSDASNENIPITPHGTGSVVVSKIDVAAGEIDGTAIGANSASTGAFTTIAASGNADLNGDVNVAGELQTANIGYTDGDNAITIADGGGMTFPQNLTLSAELKLSNDQPIVWGTSNSSNIRGSHGASGYFKIRPGASNVLYLTASGQAVLNEEESNANMTRGLTINQLTSDNQIFALKSYDDVAHDMSAIAESDTFGFMAKNSGTDGGLGISGLTQGNTALVLGVRVTTEHTDDTTSSSAAWGNSISKSNGSGSHQALGSTANLISIANYSTCRFVMKGDGTVHASDTSWATALDDMPDALAGRAYTTEMARRHGDGLLGGMEVDAPELVQRMEDAGIVTHAEKEGEGTIPGHRFLNVQKGIKFSWDMGFQNFKWMAEMAKVLSAEQRAALPEDMQSAFAALEANESQFIQEKN